MASLDDLARAPSLGRYVRSGWARDDARARAAWVLAVEVSATLMADVRFASVFEAPGRAGRTSDNKTAIARKLACYLAVIVADCPVTCVAKASGLNRKTVDGHLTAVEDWREEEAWDAVIEAASRELVGMAAQVVFGALALVHPGEVAA
ncbi:hypothetical protein [Brevundimonas sp. A19_0]|uniref:hypothetical protein n=1 Tax=Brevundimonas sp. A19_0 TaxID=2821087 RepID=UPI001ADBD924|nr:hypothetical protein [Brevundimonas sp. A19_0]MBO9502039.1 hypothetical protein [Brevundimonas sp. A19_0]